MKNQAVYAVIWKVNFKPAYRSNLSIFWSENSGLFVGLQKVPSKIPLCVYIGQNRGSDFCISGGPPVQWLRHWWDIVEWIGALINLILWCLDPKGEMWLFWIPSTVINIKLHVLLVFMEFLFLKLKIQSLGLAYILSQFIFTKCLSQLC